VECGDLIDVVSDVEDWPHVRESVHTVRFLYDVTLIDGALRAEVDGTTDRVEWQALEHAFALPLMLFVRAVLERR
jgi:hypothetical protein